jgi:hypothetical protein
VSASFDRQQQRFIRRMEELAGEIERKEIRLATSEPTTSKTELKRKREPAAV